MRIAVAGASGRTGRLVVERALGLGHEVSALARRTDAITAADPRVTVFAADVTEPRTLAGPLEGCDAIISAIGAGTSRGPTDVYSAGTRNLLKAADAAGATTLAVISAAPVGPRSAHPPMQRVVVLPILDRLFGASYTDMARMETILERAELEWACLRPPRLLARTATGAYRVGAEPLPRMRSITHADLAHALLDAVERLELRGRPLFVAN